MGLLKNNNQIFDYELIIIDDGSIDKTREIVKNLIKNNKKIKINNKRENHGKGYSVKEGVFLSKLDWILFLDADMSTSVKELNNFFNFLQGYDILIGSRYLDKSRVEMGIKRKIIGRGFAIINNFILGLRIKDTQCGFKLFRKNVAKKLFKLQKINGFAFDVEILYLAKKFNYKIKEIPVNWIENHDGGVYVIKDSFKMLFDLFRTRCIRYDIK